MSYRARAHVLYEASYRQLLENRPNVAVLPWGATEAHNYHLPHGADIIEATTLAEAAAQRANAQGARCLVLPAVPFGINHTQLSQVATITMRASTQQAVLFDVADSLVRQGIDRLVILNMHGGNDFRSMIRDVMLDLPIFIVQINGYEVAPEMRKLLAVPKGDHADEFETSYLMHIAPHLVAPLATAGDGATTPYALPSLKNTPGTWAPRSWEHYTKDSGVGDPRQATAEKGRQIAELLIGAIAPVLTELSRAKNGDFPYVVKART